MWCYFLLHGHVSGVEVLPLGLSDEQSVARAHILLSKRKAAFDGLEVWDGARFVFSQPLFPTRRLPPICFNPLRARSRHPQNDVTIGLACAAHLSQPGRELAVEPHSDQAVLPRGDGALAVPSRMVS
jgi:hypothetical protein